MQPRNDIGTVTAVQLYLPTTYRVKLRLVRLVLCSRYSDAHVYRIVSEANEPIQGLHI